MRQGSIGIGCRNGFNLELTSSGKTSERTNRLMWNSGNQGTTLCDQDFESGTQERLERREGRLRSNPIPVFLSSTLSTPPHATYDWPTEACSQIERMIS